MHDSNCKQHDLSMTFPAGQSLRGYQNRIVDSILKENTIVLLPTGAGKTPIAAVAIRKILNKYPLSKAVLFVPTVALVSQQAAVMRDWNPFTCVVGEFHGSVSFPFHFDILVTTPKAFERELLRGHYWCSWEKYSAVVFDEVHHAIKDHPYRTLAQRLGKSASSARVVGMTASLTYAVGTAKVFAASQSLCDLLRISRIEVASDEELRHGGYRGPPSGTVAELRPHLQESLLLPAAVAMGSQGAAGEHDEWGGSLLPPDERKPHLMYAIFFGRIADGTATRCAQLLLRCLRAVERDVAAADSQFCSPLTSPSLVSWGVYAHKRGEQHSRLLPLYRALESWYEACRILVTSWEEGGDLAVQFLRLMGVEAEAAAGVAVGNNKSLSCRHHQLYIMSGETKLAMQSFFAAQPASFPRFDTLLALLGEKNSRCTRNSFRGILFVKQRVTAHILEHFLLSAASSSSSVHQDYSSSTSNSSFLRPAVLYSSTSCATPSLKVTRSQGAQALAAFRTGSCNLLVATSVAEEGVDVPEANCVIYFDPIDTSVSYVQGRGRARQQHSSFVMMAERVDRPAAVLAGMELEQHAIASTFQPSVRNNITANSTQRGAQRSRELGALHVLTEALLPTVGHIGGAGTRVVAAAEALYVYCKKTKALFNETYKCSGEEEGGGWTCTLSYESILRSVTVSNASTGGEATKKAAKQQVSLQLLGQLLHLTREDYAGHHHQRVCGV